MGVWGGVGSSQATLPYFQTTIPFFLIPLGALLHLFVLVEITTLFFPWDCALFDKKPGDVGGTPTGCLGIRRDSCAQHAVVPSRYRKTRYMHLKLPAGRCCLFCRSFL